MYTTRAQTAGGACVAGALILAAGGVATQIVQASTTGTVKSPWPMIRWAMRSG